MILLNGQELKFKTFPNGETLVDGDQINSIGELTNHFVFKYENDNDLIKLMFVKRHIDNTYSSTEIENYLHIAYMPYSRQDRVEGNSVFTLKYVSEFINNLGFDIVYVIDAHSDVTPALLNKSWVDSRTPELIDAVASLIDFDNDNDFLCFPDAGAQKRYSIDGYQNVVGFKKRDFKTGKIKSLQVVGDTEQIQGKKIVLVDDMSSFGGTFYGIDKETGAEFGIAHELKKLGASEVYLLVTHSEHNIFKGKLFAEGSPINKVFTTNTIINETDVPEGLENKIKIFNIIGGK